MSRWIIWIVLSGATPHSLLVIANVIPRVLNESIFPPFVTKIGNKTLGRGTTVIMARLWTHVRNYKRVRTHMAFGGQRLR